MTGEQVRVWAIVLAPLLCWTIVSPQSAWRVLVSWRYANPDAVRPSSAGYEARRMAAALALAVLVVWAATA